MKTQTQDRKKTLIIIYHSVCHLRGMSEQDRDNLLSGYGATSSKELNEKQLLEIIEKLQQDVNLWRRRVMAAVGAWLRSVNREDNLEVIKAIATRAASAKTFNTITQSELVRVYNEFCRKAKTSTAVSDIKADELMKQQIMN